MTNTLRNFAVLAAILASFCPGVSAQSLLDQVETAASTGSVDVSLRSRLETVLQDNALSDAAAATLRTRLTLQSGAVNGFSGVLELDNVSVIGADHYDSLVRDRYRGAYSVIADPVGSEVNQAYVGYAPDAGQSFRLGRQRVNHAAQRFLGSVAWRQNEQTLDAISYSKRGERFSLDYSYVWNVNRIFGTSESSVQAEDLDSDSHALYGSYRTTAGTFAGYLYALDFDNAAAASSLTFGASYGGEFGGFTVNGSVARQRDHGTNATSYAANYLSADIAYDFGSMRMLLGHESMGSDGGRAAVQTPLATLHKWQGWSDLFLTTPATGIEDSYLSLSTSLTGVSLSASYHDFSAAHGGGDYGTEWDVVASYPIRPELSVELKYASYESDGFAVDTDKFWFSLNLAF